MLGQPQFAIMSLHYLTRNIQSETGAAVPAMCARRGGSAQRSVPPVRRESQAVVANA